VTESGEASGRDGEGLAGGDVHSQVRAPEGGDETRDERRAAAARLPWEGKPTRADIACLLVVSLSGYYYLALIPLTASLIGTNPVLLSLLSGSMPAMVAAGAFARVGRASLALALAAGVPGLMIFDPFYWWAGHRWGPRAMVMLTGRRAGASRMVARVERLFGRIGWLAVVVGYFLPVPSLVIDAIAGWTGMTFVRFLIFDVLGALLRTVFNVSLGYAIGHSAVAVATRISHDALWVTLGLLGVVFAWQGWRAHRERSRPHDVDDPTLDTSGADPG
jgi:membrane protein DedA with SNARE-associated domain